IRTTYRAGCLFRSKLFLNRNNYNSKNYSPVENRADRQHIRRASQYHDCKEINTMAEASQIMFSYKEVVEALIKKQGLHEGIWGLSVKLGMQATNVGANESDLKPSAVVAILDIGLQKSDKETNLTLDAAKVNPKARASRHN